VAWWRQGVFYEIYPRSFADSDGDGVGDLRGIVSKLDYLRALGVDGLWLNPTFPSPNVDWGYDVSDYLDVHPELGTLADLDLLIAEARRRGIWLFLDLVPNHTSNQHAWFRERPEFYLWRDRIPNNWLAAFGNGPAWTYDDERGAYYFHNFAPEQPDLDWWNEDVRSEFDRILRFWFDRGVAGFRIDVANALIKDRELRDNPAATQEWGPWGVHAGIAAFYNANRPEVHEIYRRWRAVADEYDPPRAFVGEAWVWDYARWASYYGSGDELDMLFAFHLTRSPLEGAAVREAVERTEAVLGEAAWPALTGSNHDVGRFATRWAGGDERKARAGLSLLLTLRGTPFLYMGDELALEDAEVPPERVRDIADPSRDPGRTPVPWTRSAEEWRKPWLPLGSTERNVEEQLADPGSTLSFTRGLIERRRAFAREPYETAAAREGVFAYRRGETELAVNLTDEESEHGGRRLAPWEGAIL